MFRKYFAKALVLIALVGGYVTAQAQMNIVVEDTAKEPIGGRLAFAIKERVRNSTGFKLVTSRNDAIFRFSLVALDDKTGYSTVYSAVFSAWQPQTDTWTYLNNIVGTCGSSRIAECAEGLVADADKAAEAPREFYKTYFNDSNKK